METGGSLDIISTTYAKLKDNVIRYQKILGRGLTASEKILVGHIHPSDIHKEIRSGLDYVFLDPDRVALQDVTGQMTLLQFMQSGLNSVVVPTTVHCDHLIQARTGGESDTKLALYENNETYLRATRREAIAELANKHVDFFTIDREVEEEILKNRDKALDYFDQLIEIDLSNLEPYIVGPHTPDLARPISKMATDVKRNSYLDTISVALIGSCTNSSYEDMSRASDIAVQAKSKGVKVKVPLQVTPGSEMIRGTIERDGQMNALKDIGANVLANACGPCIGQWNRSEFKKGIPNTIVTSYNRNFPGRNDGSRETMNFIGSPELIVALALKGRLSFNPITEQLIADDGTSFKLNPPPIASEIPENGFQHVNNVYIAPAKNPDSIEVLINKDSDRLQKLNPFPKWK